MVLIYQCEVVICAMFLTGQAGNLLIAKFAAQAPGVDLSYLRWAEAAILPGLISLIIVPVLVYRIFPPEVKRTPEAAQFATAELERLGPPRATKIMLFVFALVACLWTTTRFHQLDYAVVALLGVESCWITGVLDWEDVLSERGHGMCSSGMAVLCEWRRRSADGHH
jgi:DASS family divalent anion:Na+ symporter